MARMPRLVVPGYPHHVAQRGSRRMKTFFSPDDYQYYLELVNCHQSDSGVTTWAYCLMPNHVHFVVVPEEEDSLSRLFHHVHRHYTRYINFREKWKGHLWQERFHSFVMDEPYLLSTVRYVELNPVRAKLCSIVQDWEWSSARAHLAGEDDLITAVKPMLNRISDWRAYLSTAENEEKLTSIRKHASSGRPAGDNMFVENLEVISGRALKKAKPGPKPRN